VLAPPAGTGRGAGGSGGGIAAPAVIEVAVAVVAPAGQALRQLGGGAGRGPGRSGPRGPPVVGRLTAELIARGSAALTVPACAACGRTGRPLSRGDNGEGVCQRCRTWQRAKPCGTCGKAKPVAGHDGTGQPLCEVCFRRDDPRRHRECGACGKTAPVAVRARDGRPGICVNCYRLPEATCSKCQWRPCTFAATSQPLCPSCSPRRPPPARAAARTGRRRPAGPKARSATVLHRRAAPPRAVRGLRPGAAAGRPAWAGRGHLRRLRRHPSHLRLQ
jgi:hypothetical protein